MRDGLRHGWSNLRDLGPEKRCGSMKILARPVGLARVSINVLSVHVLEEEEVLLP